MNKKTKIQIMVIVVAFGASGWILYSGLNPSTPAPTSSIATPLSGTSSPASVMAGSGGPIVGATANNSQTLLPYGTELAGKLANVLDVMNQQNFKFSSLTYPTLDPQKDVGIPEQDILRSVVATSTQ